MGVDLDSLTLAGAARRLRDGSLSSTQLTRACLDRIEATDGTLNAFLTVAADQALAQAAESDRRFEAKRALSPLDGIPLSLKDILLTRGTTTTCASRILADFVPPFDATAVARLRQAGAVFLGKTNLDEFAMGSSNENSSRGPARNPWNPNRVPGGSSGGSAVSVAARQCLGSIGTDTGGSIRQPASFCGVVGVKPTYGRVSRYGVIAFASSLDQVGPIARDVRDAALLLEAIAGGDPRDSTSVDRDVPRYTDSLGDPVRGLRIGVPEEFFAQGLQPDVDSAVREAIDVLAGLGATVSPVSLPHTRYAVATYYLIATAEASSNLARYDGMRYGHRATGADDLLTVYSQTRDEGFGEEVKRRILLGTFALSAGYYEAYYGKAQRVRTLIRRDFDEAFRNVDVLAAPTTPTTAFRLGEKIDDPLTMYVSDVLTISANLAGLPAMSLPCGADPDGLPIGLQLLGRPFGEVDLLRAAHAYERETDWHRRHPERHAP